MLHCNFLRNYWYSHKSIGVRNLLYSHRNSPSRSQFQFLLPNFEQG